MEGLMTMGLARAKPAVGLTAFTIVLVLLAPCGVIPAAEPSARGMDLQCEYTANVFGRWDLRVSFGPELAGFRESPATQVHDAYDADRDGVFIRLSAEFIPEKGPGVTVPGFAMKSGPEKPWEWRIRWSPGTPGEWKAVVQFEGRATRDGDVIRLEQKLDKPIVARAAPGIRGRLVAPGQNQPQRYLRRLRPDGASEALWLFGACRAWVVQGQDPDNDWSPHEWLDREKELLAPMREGGFNLLNQWMAPWEFLLVHHDRAEFWRDVDGKWRRMPLPKDEVSTPFQRYDQGRALAFDDLVRLCEGDAGKETVYLLLSPLPHQCLQLKEHPWGAQESGWSPEDDAGKQTMARLNGFSAFRKSMSVWEFFEADPRRPLDDWRARLFDHQANFVRYLIARWGYSRAIGVWVLVDELDAVGDVVGVMSEKKGWWAHPHSDRWLADMVRLFRGELVRSDGLRYPGDPWRHPLHAATTSYGGQAGRGSNMAWPGGPQDARPDLLGWHWYPYWEDPRSWAEVWGYTIDGVVRYGSVPAGDRARLISEFGAPDRRRPSDAPSLLYPGLYHFAIWSALFSGLSGTPMDWDDGKEFGELRWRERKGAFQKDVYPIDHVAQVQALRAFLGDVTPDDVLHVSRPDSKMRCEPEAGVTTLALFTRRKDPAVLGWLYSPEGKGRLKVIGLAPGRYRLTWHDPWTGIPFLWAETLQEVVVAKGALDVDAGPVLAKARATAAKFPDESRVDRGRDVAFTIGRIEGN